MLILLLSLNESVMKSCSGFSNSGANDSGGNYGAIFCPIIEYDRAVRFWRPPEQPGAQNILHMGGQKIPRMIKV